MLLPRVRRVYRAVTAHEVLHTFGAVSSAAPNECDGESSGHTCDNEGDLMFPSIGGEALSSKILDPGRDDYYGHAGGSTDTADSAWLVQARQPGAARRHGLRPRLRVR